MTTHRHPQAQEIHHGPTVPVEPIICDRHGQRFPRPRITLREGDNITRIRREIAESYAATLHEGREQWLAEGIDLGDAEVDASDFTVELHGLPRRDDPLVRLAHHRDEAERLQATVDEARRAGRTWDQIGQALGITRQAAHERFANSR